MKNLVTFHMSTLGDLLFSLPALDALRAKFADAQLTSVVPNAYVELLTTTGLSHRIVGRGSEGWKSAAKLFGDLRTTQYELAVCFSQSRGSVIQAIGCGTPRRVGFEQSRLAWLLTERIKREGPPSTVNNLRLVERLGCEPRRRDYIGFIQPGVEQKAVALKLLHDGGVGKAPFAVIGTGASAKRSIKEWTTTGFAEVIAWLHRERGLQCVAVGTERPDELLATVGDGLRDLTGKTSLVELAALLARAQLFVGIDSGVMHLAAAMGTPVVGIFGPTDPQHTGPAGERSIVVRREIPCSPCMSSWCRIKTRECLEALEPLNATQVIAQVLGGNDGSGSSGNLSGRAN